MNNSLYLVTKHFVIKYQFSLCPYNVDTVYSVFIAIFLEIIKV